MSISPIGVVSPSSTVTELKAPGSPQAATNASPVTLKPDTVSISHQGQAAAKTGDVDHDGDGH